MQTHYDIVIVGGGLVGASLAAALRHTSLSVALIDKELTQTKKDARLIALNHNSMDFLRHHHLWNALIPYATPIREVHVSHQGHFGSTRFTAKEIDVDALGYVVPAIHINQVLYDALFQAKNIALLQPSVLKDFDESTFHLSIETATGEKKITAKIMIGADGTQSTLRKQLRIPVEMHDYQQSAIVTTTELHRSHQHIAYERFQKKGAIAMLPLQENRVATIWSDDNDRITELMQMDNVAFLDELQKQFGYRLGKLKSIQERAIFPIKMLKMEPYTNSRIQFIGNAAHTLHPIAAQGLNIALQEVAKLADYFCDPSFSISAEIPHLFSKQHFNLHLSHHLTRIFSDDFFVARFTRQAIMLGLDNCLVAKRYFGRRAMGKKAWK